MRSIDIAVLTLALVVGFAPPSEASKVRAGMEEGADLGAYRTFAWKQTSAVLPPEAHEVLQTTAEEVLVSRGMSPSPPEEADIILSYKVLATDRADVKAYGYADPDKWGIAEYGGTDIRAYIQGRLAVYAEDRRTGALVWSAEGEAAVKDPEDARKKVAKIAKRMFKAWPKVR
jgi:hypothetical protein